MRTNIANLSTAQLDTCIKAVERLQTRPADDMLQLILGAIEASTSPTLICAADGTIFAVNDAAVSLQVVISPLAVHVTDVIIGGDAVWAAMLECIDDPRRAVVVLPTCTGVVCAWRISRRDDLYLIVAEHVGADGADAYAKQANGESASNSPQTRSARFTSHRRQRNNRGASSAAKRTNGGGLNSSDSSTTTTNDDAGESSDSSADAVQSDESNLRTLSQSKQPRPRSPLQAALVKRRGTPDTAVAPNGSALVPQPASSAPPASPLPSSDSSRSSSTPPLPTRSMFLSGSGSVARKQASVSRTSSKSRLNTCSATVDFGNDPTVVRNVIYSGPMSTVVRATVGGFDVAAKILPTRYMSNEEKAELRATLMLAAALQHHNVVRQLGFNLNAAHEWIEYTELCDKSLDEHIRNAPVTVNTVCQALQVAQGIQFMHAKSVMHRDIKAQNVLVRMVDGEAVLKLSDLGDAAVIVSGQSYRTGVGTPEFMAPEVVPVATVRFRAYGAPCDIWSFGMLMFELLTGGSVPYSDVSHWKLGETIAAGVRPTLPAKTDRGGLIEAQLIELFVDCSRLRPDERLTASTICSRLEKMLKNLNI